MSDDKLKWALFVMRLSLAAFFAVWAMEKFLHPETTMAIWSHFYSVENMPEAGSYAIGVVQSAAIICFVLGLAKFWSYGFFMAIHAVTVVVSYEQLFNPYSGGNHLFWAAVPTLGALVALFMLRDADTKFTLSSGGK